MKNDKCPFCHQAVDRIVFKNELCYALYDRFPVSNGHLLVIPFRHFSSYFEATAEETAAIWSLVSYSHGVLQEKYKPDGFNIGINIGQHSGQTIFHLHVHVIPRYRGDVENPRGGVRGVIESKRIYSS